MITVQPWMGWASPSIRWVRSDNVKNLTLKWITLRFLTNVFRIFGVVAAHNSSVGLCGPPCNGSPLEQMKQHILLVIGHGADRILLAQGWRDHESGSLHQGQYY